MVKIYNAVDFLEADRIIDLLKSNQINAEKQAVSQMNILVGNMTEVYDIYVAENDMERALELIKQIKSDDNSFRSWKKKSLIRIGAILGLLIAALVVFLIFL